MNSFDHWAAAALCRVLRSTHNLKTLYLSAASCDTLSSVALVNAVKGLSKLSHLDLIGNPIGKEGGKALAAAFSHTPHITELHVQKCFPDGDASAFIAALPLVPRLHYLNMHTNPLSTHSIDTLTGVMAKLPRLKTLRFNSCPSFDDRCAKALASSMGSFPNLLELRLSKSGMSPVGVTAISSSLHHTPRLTNLNLATCEIEDGGVTDLARALPHLRSLRQLVLSGNPIGNTGAAELLAALPYVPSLSQCTIDGSVSKTVRDHISDTLSVPSADRGRALTVGLLNRIDALEQDQLRQTQQAAEYLACTPAACESLRALIKEVKQFDATSLSTHIAQVVAYSPLTEGVTTHHKRLVEFMTEHPTTKVSSEDCTALCATLDPLLSALQVSLAAVSELDFDPAASISQVKTGAALLRQVAGVNSYCLPASTFGLTLTQKRQYHIATEYNTAEAALYTAACALIDLEDTLLASSTIADSLSPLDAASCSADLESANVLLQTLQRLAPLQEKATALLHALGEIDPVEDGEIANAEYDLKAASLHVENPRVSESERQGLQLTMTKHTARLADLKQRERDRNTLLSQLAQYLMFEAVAKALGREVQSGVEIELDNQYDGEIIKVTHDTEEMGSVAAA
ncbi:hypothetical protein KIPB_007328 [Kipferlia bialata]|uniref:Uncharacterized protein n=1 Tax=Kipferlia bialata TaxID=797122 RepID=A0A391NV05_9EUKA|nr:hypothetical protein KIPB_007328 [Kipferlia bialata]|eukprot:g7328.t1